MHNFNVCTGWKSLCLKDKTNSEQQINPENFSSIGQILLEISVLEGKNRGIKI